MCGLFGYTGRKEASRVLLDGIRRLEYRGYDSAGVVTGTADGLHVRRSVGRVTRLAELLGDRGAPGRWGLAHTRWATHGRVSEANAHPHVDAGGCVAVVHNGVVENYRRLRDELAADGVCFHSETDTEVLAQLIGRLYAGDLLTAVRQALIRVKGMYAVGVVCRHEPGVIVAARRGSPVVFGQGDDGFYLASDAHALAGFTRGLTYLDDRRICRLTETDGRVWDEGTAPVAAVHDAPATYRQADPAPFPHFMLKEIFDQPGALEEGMRGRLDDESGTARFDELDIPASRLRQVSRLVLTGCGTSYHAGLVGEYLLEELARIPVEVEYASEFRYRNAPVDRDTLVIAVTQSGETADTLAALREARRVGLPTLSVCNVPGSSVARESDGDIELRAGAEFGVASTKAFTSQCLVLALLALHIGRTRHLSRAEGERVVRDLTALPGAVRRALGCHDAVKRVAARFADTRNVLYLGRQYLYPVALEGALKLKEISYIHAEGYPAAEMKHGPIALVDENTPSVFLVPRGDVFDKVMSNMQEIKARGGPVIAVAADGGGEVAQLADELILVPDVPDYLEPVVAAVPLQLLAYEIAVLRGCDVDKPRNLAKSVTVE
ncbi:glutamine--fructose-6-phosphate transaminase (isomerizing) [bacterium]|nr:glutamine--fructose-6-phosphate transaminase (isomerizing) [bacterium]